MSSLVISGDTSGTITVAAPAVAGSNTLTLLAATATMSVNTLATAVASTSGTSIDFTGLPAWVKRITVMLSGVSLSGTSNFVIQIGAGSVTTSGYVSTCNNGAGTNTSNTSGFLITVSAGAADGAYGIAMLSTLGSNIWTQSGLISGGGALRSSSGGLTLGGTLDRVRITTVNGTDTFDAGTINILYEG